MACCSGENIFDWVSICFFSVIGVSLRIGLSESVEGLRRGFDGVYSESVCCEVGDCENRSGTTTLPCEDRDRESSSDPDFDLDHAYLLSLFIGCLVLGIVTKVKEQRYKKDKQLRSLFLGISTGFCGSLTTLSSFLNEPLLESYHAMRLVKECKRVRSNRGSILLVWMSLYSLFETVLTGLCVSWCGYRLGLQFHSKVERVNDAVEETSDNEKPKQSQSESNCRDYQKTCILISVGLLLIIVVPLITLMYKLLTMDSESDLAAPLISNEVAVFVGPFGTLLRWKLGKFNNQVTKAYYGTFMANLSGCLFIAVLSVIETHLMKSVSGREGEIITNLLTGISVGFCGSLTTVSTFISELNNLGMHAAIKYAGYSIAVPVFFIFMIYLISALLSADSY